MNRREFTKNLARLIDVMVAEGNEPVLDYVLRSEQEQNRLFRDGASKCDGYVRKSRHQFARAADIYFFVDGKIDFDYEKTNDLAVKYHALWESWGGAKMIAWDKGHYEG